jgi:hypothetical protein
MVLVQWNLVGLIYIAIIKMLIVLCV